MRAVFAQAWVRGDVKFPKATEILLQIFLALPRFARDPCPLKKIRPRSSKPFASRSHYGKVL